MIAYNTDASGQRRSERVSIGFGLEITGTDSAGQRFSDAARTRTVSRFGCCLALPRLLDKYQPVQLHRSGTNETTMGQVVAAMGDDAGLHLYGVGTDNSCESLWGIRFSWPFYQRVLDSVQEGVSFVNRDRQITYWNAGAERLTGYSGSEAVGRQCFSDFMAHIDQRGKPLCGQGCPLSEVLSTGVPYDKELFLRHKQGHRVPVRVRVLPNQNAEGEIIGAVEIFSDSQFLPKADNRVYELAQLAFLDPLTGLPNRRSLEMKVIQALDECSSFGRQYGLLMFDLDGFKRINDSYGHNTGDALLKVTAKTMVQGMRPVDTVGRWGGEEFLLLMPDVSAIELGDLAERCRVLVAGSSVPCEGQHVSVTASIGATVLNPAESPESAVQRVDGLMYQSKRSGGDQTTAG